jgi:malate synthase
MTQKEILKYAINGIKAEINHERAINQIGGGKNEIALRFIAELTEKLNTTEKMLADLEEAEQKKANKWYNKIKNKRA